MSIEAEAREFFVKHSGVNIFSIHYPGQNIHASKTKAFYPGVNKITQEEWEAIKVNKNVPHLFDSGVLIWVDGGPEKKGKPFSFKDLPSKEAKKIVEETFKVELLEEWRADEKRGDVLKAISVQLDKVTKYSKPEAEDTEQ